MMHAYESRFQQILTLSLGVKHWYEAADASVDRSMNIVWEWDRGERL